MIYNNIIYFLAVIFTVSSSTIPDQTWLPPWLGLTLFALLVLAFSFLAKRLFDPYQVMSSQRYFSAEKRGTMLATVLFTGSFFAFDLKYY
ncbi:MAG: hypothetical protein D3916_16690, partial [Candidatus Electrothrix sp. MAN1_4]|nr:hypothetical protein [Candidatus Electrothrix sp. MAN1_4]